MTEYILGINCSHDGSVALFRDNKLLGTSTKERHTRKKKHTNGNYKPIVDKLLNKFNVDKIDYIAYNDNYLEEDSAFDLKRYCNIYFDKPNCSYVETYVNNENTYAINHHLGHCAYAYYTSNFNKSVCISLDGSPNEYEYVALGKMNKLNKYVHSSNTYASILYDWITYYLLGNPLYKSGTVMGLSAYGKVLDTDYKKYNSNNFSEYFKKWTGQDPVLQKDKKNVTQTDMDVAATLQYIFENLIIDYINSIPLDVIAEHDYNLCLSGGTFLNCNLNTKIIKKTPFKNIHIAPACSDDGLSVGYGLYLIHNILNKPRTVYNKKDLMYSELSYECTKGSPIDIEYVCKQLRKGKVVGLFQGKGEFGPRALGNRSILADPTNPNIKDYINKEIKDREWFRPFGATVLKEHSQEWFDNTEESPYMLFTYNVKKDSIPAVTHIDGTCRIQTLDRETNELFYDIIKEFYIQTGVPMLLNTSFNGNNEPIVETPEDALNFFNNSRIDILILENRMILKHV